MPGLENEPLNFYPSSVRSLAWSEEGELAIAAGKDVHILIPNRRTHPPTPTPWFHVHECVNIFSTAEWPHQEPATFTEFSIGEELSSCHVIALDWSPAGLAKHGRCVLAVLTSNLLLSIWVPDSDPLKSWRRDYVVNIALDAYFDKIPKFQWPLRKRRRIRAMAWAAQLNHETCRECCNKISKYRRRPDNQMPPIIQSPSSIMVLLNDFGETICIRLPYPRYGEFPRDVGEVLGYKDYRQVVLNEIPSPAECNIGVSPWMAPHKGEISTVVTCQIGHHLIHWYLSLEACNVCHSGLEKLEGKVGIEFLCTSNTGNPEIARRFSDGKQVDGSIRLAVCAQNIELLDFRRIEKKSLPEFILNQTAMTDSIDYPSIPVHCGCSIVCLGKSYAPGIWYSDMKFFEGKHPDTAFLCATSILSIYQVFSVSFKEQDPVLLPCAEESGLANKFCRATDILISEKGPKYSRDSWGLASYRGYLATCITLRPAEMPQYTTRSAEAATIVFTHGDLEHNSLEGVNFPWEQQVLKNDPVPGWLGLLESFSSAVGMATLLRTSFNRRLLYSFVCACFCFYGFDEFDNRLVSNKAIEIFDACERASGVSFEPERDLIRFRSGRRQFTAQSLAKLITTRSQIERDLPNHKCFLEYCTAPRCGMPLQWGNGRHKRNIAICDNRHAWERCTLSWLAIQLPGVSKYCEMCNAEYLDEDCFAQPGIKNSMNSSSISAGSMQLDTLGSDMSTQDFSAISSNSMALGVSEPNTNAEPIIHHNTMASSTTNKIIESPISLLRRLAAARTQGSWNGTPPQNWDEQKDGYYNEEPSLAYLENGFRPVRRSLLHTMYEKYPTCIRCGGRFIGDRLRSSGL